MQRFRFGASPIRYCPVHGPVFPSRGFTPRRLALHLLALFCTLGVWTPVLLVDVVLVSVPRCPFCWRRAEGP